MFHNAAHQLATRDTVHQLLRHGCLLELLIFFGNIDIQRSSLRSVDLNI